ncbi:hypothetical protein BJ170DRAFT_678125 [Xylariales sp. AK1849]|nr:hypothetical protein BJ170DRAFT_678125 [Xylariales sp. AK1849]
MESSAADHEAFRNPNLSPQVDEEEDDDSKHARGGRQCTICLGFTFPVYEEPNVIERLRGKKPRKVYRDSECGHLISPCQCKGSMKYIHENCLQDWRYSDNASDNFYRCRTCGYRYQFERMDWARRARSPILAFFMAVAIVTISIFLLGFVGDQVLNLWIDPVGTIAEGVGLVDTEPEEVLGLADLDEEGWSLHFVKGLLSLGLLGFLKTFLVMSPWQWWNMRATGLVGGPRRRGTGRDRLENISLALVAIGAITFFWAVWTGTRKWTQRTLDRTSERILNVQDGDGDDDDNDAAGDEHAAADNPATANSNESKKDQ